MKKTLLLLLVLALPLISFAQADIGFYGVGGRLGYVMPESEIKDTFGLGLNADLGTITPDIALEGFIDYWSVSYDAAAYWGSDFEWKYSLFAIGALGKYYFPQSGSYDPYVGGGLSLNFYSFESPAGYNPYTNTYEKDSSSKMSLGIHMVAGAKMELSETLDGFAEVKYTVSKWDYFGIYVGVMYKLGK